MATYHPQGMDTVGMNFAPLVSASTIPRMIYSDPHTNYADMKIDSNFTPANLGILPMLYLGPLGGGALVPATYNTIMRLNPSVSVPFVEDGGMPALLIAF